MAYTYDDFTKAATSAGVLDSFDQNDLDYAKKYPEFGLSMVSLKRDLSNAKTDEQKLLASEAINQLRKNYGSYWTGDAGNRSYAASYGSKINDTMKQIDNYGNFTYDPSTDPLYSDYKKAYLREGERAAANALAQSSAATGGVPSSYAQTAAQQAANYYAGKVADAIPTLREQALNEWNNGLNVLRSNLSMYQGQDDSDYKRYLDMINAEYQKERDAVADAQQELANALQIYQMTGKVTGPLKDLLAAAVSSGGGSSGGGGYSGGGGTTKKTTTPASSVSTKTASQALADTVAKTVAATGGTVQNPIASSVYDLTRTTVANAAKNAAASKNSGQTASLYGVNKASAAKSSSSAAKSSSSAKSSSAANIKALGAR